MATEKTMQEGIQAVVQGVTDWFEPGDVTINDWSVLDFPVVRAPYLVIVNNDEFSSQMDTTDTQDRFTLKAWLIVYLGGRKWKDALDDLRDSRQAILDAFNTVGTARSLGGIEGLDVRRVYSLSETGYIYQQGVDPELNADATPEYLTQLLGFEVEQF